MWAGGNSILKRNVEQALSILKSNVLFNCIKDINEYSYINIAIYSYNWNKNNRSG